jgi:predicted transcriptional regulator
MGRPRIYDEPRIATAIRLPTSLRTELQMAAARRDVSVNYLVTRAVAEFLGRHPSPADGIRGGGRARRSVRTTGS